MHRRGSIYLVVLSTVTVVALLGTAGVLAQTRQRARAETAHDTARAAALARAAVELGMQHISEDDRWRTDRGKGEWFADAAPTGDERDGTFTLTVCGPSGATLGADPDDPFEMIGIGTYGDARRQIIVPFEAVSSAKALDCLEVGALGGNTVTLEFNAAVLGDETLASKIDVKANTAFVHVPVEAENKVEGAVYTSTTASSVSARTLPACADIARTYDMMGVLIPRSQIPRVSNVHLLTNAALGPGHNPYKSNTLNDDGIYSIMLNGRDVVIENFRMHGTLVLYNPGSGSVIRGSNSFTPVVEGYPALIVSEGDMTFQMTADDLSESSVGVNFNPAGVPDARGVEDSDTADTYPSSIEGIVHIEGDAVIATGANLVIEGHLFADNEITMDVGAILRLDTWSEARNVPPPGYADGDSGTTLTMQPWRRDLD